MLSQGPAFFLTALHQSPSTPPCRGVPLTHKKWSHRQRAVSQGNPHSMCQTLWSPVHPHPSTCPGPRVGCLGTSEKQIKD